MSKASDAGNAVVYTAVKTCELYRVKVLRMQSRVVWVPGAAGRPRPMFFGKWTDDDGKERDGGMADLLARPQIAATPWTMMIHNSKEEDSLVDVLEGNRMILPCTTKENASALIARQRASRLDNLVTQLVWIECKSGKGRMTEDQIRFKNHVEANGETYLLLHNDMRPLTTWLEEHGIKELGKR